MGQSREGVFAWRWSCISGKGSFTLLSLGCQKAKRQLILEDRFVMFSPWIACPASAFALIEGNPFLHTWMYIRKRSNWPRDEANAPTGAGCKLLGQGPSPPAPTAAAPCSKAGLGAMVS